MHCTLRLHAAATAAHCSPCSCRLQLRRTKCLRSGSLGGRQQCDKCGRAEQGKGDVRTPPLPCILAFDGPVPSTQAAFLWRSAARSEARRRTIRAVDVVRTSLGTVHPATSVCGRREHARTHAHSHTHTHKDPHTHTRTRAHTHTKIHTRTRAHAHTHGDRQVRSAPCSFRQSRAAVGRSAPFIRMNE
jgi:hypothetical protein